MTEEEKEKGSDEIQLVAIPTGQAHAYKFPDGTIIESEQELLLWIANMIYKINKAVA